MAGQGDRLARGAAKATFPAGGSTETEQSWQEKIGGFDSKTYLENEAKKDEEARQRRAQKEIDDAAEAVKIDAEREERRRNTNAEEAGVPGLMSAQDIANSRS
jgi:hypothetical protein